MRTLALLPLLGMLAVACRGPGEETDETGIVDGVDNDADGYTAAEDCDDADASINPGATEVCDGVDNDCDGAIDDGAAGTTFYADGDGDGYGDDSKTESACEAPSGYVAQGGDCDDSSTAYHPGASEEDCTDPADYNCDGSSGFTDADADGSPACEDCNDLDAAINQSATEICDGVDNDCDAETDEEGATGGSTFYADADGDGYGSAAGTTEACEAPTGYVSDASDCDDASASVNPGASETCNSTDDDCDGSTDEEPSDATTWYADTDADGYGDAATSQAACAQPTGFVADATDCDDAAAGVNPGASETCNGTDDDCNGTADDGATDPKTYYKDADGDGVGIDSDTVTECAPPSGYASTSGDCDDANPAVAPGAAELCDDVDSDCDGETRDADSTDAVTFYTDADADGYGDDSSTVAACDLPTGAAAEGGDCDESSADINPGAAEICNGIDDDCDEDVDPEDKVLGGGKDCAAESCKDLITARPTAPNGVYYLQPPGVSAAFLNFCLNNYDGGGWTLVLKADGSKPTFAYDAAYWTDNKTLLGVGSPAYNRTEAKLASWNSVAFDDVLVGIEAPAASTGLPKPKLAKLPQKADSMHALMSPNVFVPTTLGRTAWKGLITDSSLQPNCNREGFNNYHDYARVRIGIIANQENDCASPDSRLGIGGAGTACGQDGTNAVGNTAVCSPDNGNKNIKGFGWIFVR